MNPGPLDVRGLFRLRTPMAHVFVFALFTAPAERLVVTDDAPRAPDDAPLIVLLDGVPTLDRLVKVIVLTDDTVEFDVIKAKLAAQGLTDNTLAQSMVLLTRARADGHWPSIENRMEDGSLIC